jgi:RNA polymerase sigma-70 factor, ECF subfamily
MVFMDEGERVVARSAILSEAATLVHGRDAQSRDEALEDLVRQHARLVYRIAYAALRSHHDAEDAAQEAFVRVLRYSARLGEVDNPKTWLARIAWRVAVERSRRSKSRREIPLDDPEKPLAEVASPDAAADEVLHGAEIGGALEKLISALPEKLRQPLLLSTLEEMTPREVAGTLGINEASVRSRVFRARQILREKLAAQVGRKQGQKS